ncbi:MAG: hypothetical protein PHU01_13400 [Desulfuromonadaceae bacterium]|nr:hypothetical protein [Desulfuromonadaceae bacterium]
MTLEYLKYKKMCKRYDIIPLPPQDEPGRAMTDEEFELHKQIYNEANDLEYIKYVKKCVFYGIEPKPFLATNPKYNENDMELHIQIFNEANKPHRLRKSKPAANVPGIIFSALFLGTGLVANLCVSALGLAIGNQKWKE